MSRPRSKDKIGFSDSSKEEDTKPFLLHRQVEVKKDGEVEEDYTLGEFIGSGKFGDVSRCKEKQTGYELAAKVIPIHSKEEEISVMNEVMIMNKLRHARLIQLYDVYASSERITLIMELITGGELFERVIDENFDLNEGKCVKFMKEILQGVDYIHSQNIIHLDLKPENILCLSRTGFKIKIIDFGLAREVTRDELRVLFGTPEFVAPEVISYDPVSYASDMWSVGVICYVLLSGLSPFMGDTQGETLTNIIRCVYSFNYTEFKDISNEAKDLIRNLLVKNTSTRYTSSQCLAHAWFKDKVRLKRNATVNKKRLKHFVYRRKWQKAVNAIVALQRMGVNLTHATQKQDIRKCLQVRSSKTTSVSRRASLQAPIQEANVDPVDMKRNCSFQSESLKSASGASTGSQTPKQSVTSKHSEVTQSRSVTPKSVNPMPSEAKPPVNFRKLQNTFSVNNNNNIILEANKVVSVPHTGEADKKKPMIPVAKALANVKQVNSLPNQSQNKTPDTINKADSSSNAAAVKKQATTLSPGGVKLPTLKINSNVHNDNSAVSYRETTPRSNTSQKINPTTPITLKMASLSKTSTGLASRIQFFTAGASEEEKKKKKSTFSLYS